MCNYLQPTIDYNAVNIFMSNLVQRPFKLRSHYLLAGGLICEMSLHFVIITWLSQFHISGSWFKATYAFQLRPRAQSVNVKYDCTLAFSFTFILWVHSTFVATCATRDNLSCFFPLVSLYLHKIYQPGINALHQMLKGEFFALKFVSRTIGKKRQCELVFCSARSTY